MAVTQPINTPLIFFGFGPSVVVVAISQQREEASGKTEPIEECGLIKDTRLS